MFCSYTGFYESYTKKTLEMVPWICTHTSHLTKVLCQRHIRNFTTDIKHIASRILSHIDLERGLLHNS